MRPTPRAAALGAAGAVAWLAGLTTGSVSVRAFAALCIALPLACALTLARRMSAHRLEVTRSADTLRVEVGIPVELLLRIANPTARTTSLLVVEDEMPPSLGGRRAALLPPVSPGTVREVRTTVVPTTRGRHRIGPVRFTATDPFGLVRATRRVDRVDELVVIPRIEPLGGPARSPGARIGGRSGARRVSRGVEDFSSMREYRQGDDLRRIHWPSVARRGELMIRQDENPSRSRTALFIDTRERAAGRHGDDPFERMVSVAASIGVREIREGSGLRLATTILPPRPVDEAGLLDALAGVTSDGGDLATALARLRSASAGDAGLVAVMSKPAAADAEALLRAGLGFGRRTAVMVGGPDDADGSATAAAVALARAGWRVVTVTEGRPLREAWERTGARARIASRA